MKNKRVIVREFKLSLYDRLLEKDWADPKIVRKDTLKELTIISKNSGSNNYPIYMSDNEYYSLNGKNESGYKLLLVYNKKAPIISERIVYDITFALRLRSFLEDTQVNDCASEEEKEYLLMVSNNLLEYQIDTVTDEGEINYLKNNGLL